MTYTQKQQALKVLVELSRVLVGITFTLSGFLKAVDPLGTAYKIDDYWVAMKLQWLSLPSLPLAMLLCSVEFLIGVFLLMGLYRRLTTKLAFLAMVVLTPFTLYIAIYSPVSDCGCFGDAFKISNWETFGKNVILLACSIMLWGRHRYIYPLFTHHVRWLSVLYSVLFIFAFMLWNYLFLPVFDFRPYHVGANIAQLKEASEENELFENVFAYEKNGKKQTFTEENYPWQDSTWHFVEMISTPIEHNTKANVADFEIDRWKISSDKTSISGQENITQSVLKHHGYTFLMIAPKLENMNVSHLGALEDLWFYTKEHGHLFYTLTASSPEQILKHIEQTGVNYEFCATDLRTLKTIIRSNPGLLLLKNGIIVNKWPNINIPHENDIKAFINDDEARPLTSYTKEDNTDTILIVCALFIIPLLFIQLIDFVGYKRAVKVKHADNEVTLQKIDKTQSD